MLCDVIEELKIAAGGKVTVQCSTWPLANEKREQFLRKSKREVARPRDSVCEEGSDMRQQLSL